MHSLLWVHMILMGAILVQLGSTMETLLESHKIDKLPGQPEVSFQQFSGYITVDKKHQRSLFYYLVEAETDPASKPLVLWMNGGPACSAVGFGAFKETGPFRPTGEFLDRNEYSWNKEANMLYLESPAGVGFSYSANTSFYNGIDDRITARDNLIFLKKFFVKYPHFKSRDFFISGESYAGHYVPQLADLIVQSNKKEKLFNLKGIALGNPLLEYTTDFDSRSEYLWSHGLISDSTYEIFSKNCTYARYMSEYFRGSISHVCTNVKSQVDREIGSIVNPYDLTHDTCPSSFPSQTEILTGLFRTTSQPPTSQQVQENIDLCIGYKIVSYLNREDVKKALRAHLVGVPRWITCSRVLKYNLLNLEIPTLPVVGSLLKSGIAVLVYSGDQDSIVPLTGSRKLVHKLASKLGLNTTVPYRAWFDEKEVGGWTQVYGDILSFATIRGAAHEAPFTQPKRSLVLFKAFLGGKPLPEGMRLSD